MEQQSNRSTTSSDETCPFWWRELNAAARLAFNPDGSSVFTIHLPPGLWDDSQWHLTAPGEPWYTASARDKRAPPGRGQ